MLQRLRQEPRPGLVSRGGVRVRVVEIGGSVEPTLVLKGAAQFSLTKKQTSRGGEMDEKRVARKCAFRVMDGVNFTPLRPGASLGD